MSDKQELGFLPQAPHSSSARLGMEWAGVQWVPHSTCTLLGFVELNHTWFSLLSQKQNLLRALPFPHVSSLLEALGPF